LFKTPFLSHGISRLGDYDLYDYGFLFTFTAFRRRCLLPAENDYKLFMVLFIFVFNTANVYLSAHGQLAGELII